jgi:hypothetical protein
LPSPAAVQMIKWDIEKLPINRNASFCQVT